jgi:hypothetical protein
LRAASATRRSIFSTKATVETRSSQRRQVRLARKLGLDRFEPAGCVQKQRRCFAAASQVQGDLSPQALCECALELVERPLGRGRKERQRTMRVSGQLLGLRGPQRAPRPLTQIGRQRDGALEERSRRGEAATSLCAASGTFEFGGDFLVRRDGGAGPMPGAPVRVFVGVGCVGERAVHTLPVVGRS